MKNFGYAFIILALAILSISMVSAAYVAAPTAGTNQTTSFILAWTYVNGSEVTSPSSANTTVFWNGGGSYQAATFTGFACTTNQCNMTMTISSMSDGLGTINITSGNQTKNTLSNVSAQFRVDTTTPSSSISATQDNGGFKFQPVSITWASADGGSGLKSTAVTVTSPNTNLCPTTSYTTSSQSIQLTETGVACVGDWTASITATDEAGLTSTATDTFTVNEVGRSGTQMKQTAQTSNNTIVWVIAGAVILWLLFGRKK